MDHNMPSKELLKEVSKEVFLEVKGILKLEEYADLIQWMDEYFHEKWYS